MHDKSVRKYFPIMVDLSKFRVLVIGAGNIGKRKIQNLLEFSVLVNVVADRFDPEVEELISQGLIIAKKKKYESSDIDDYDLVFAATDDPSLDALIQCDCNRRGILLNVADVPSLCNFIMPSTINRGNITISIGSQGKAPFLVKHLREKLEDLISNHISEVASLASLYRDELIRTNLYYNPIIRDKLIKDFLRINWELVIPAEGFDYAKSEIDRMINIALGNLPGDVHR